MQLEVDCTQDAFTWRKRPGQARQKEDVCLSSKRKWRRPVVKRDLHKQTQKLEDLQEERNSVDVTMSRR